MTVISLAVLLGFDVGVAVWQPNPVTIGSAVVVAALFLVNLVMRAVDR